MRKLKSHERQQYNFIVRLMKDGASDFDCQRAMPSWSMSEIAEVRKQQCL